MDTDDQLFRPVTLALLMLVVGITTVVVARGQANQPPLVERPERGLIYRDMRATQPGSVCKTKLEVLNQAGKTVGCTHGPDPAPEGTNVAESVEPAATGDVTAEATGGAIICSGSGTAGRRLEVIYARASDRADRFSTYEASFRQWVLDADAIFADSARQTGESRHLRFVTEPQGGGCRVTVRNEVLTPAGDDSIGATSSELRAKGYDSVDRNYVVFVDANIYCGVAYFSNDDRPGIENVNNLGGLMARMDSGCWNGGTTAHEIMHNLGAVTDSAPHSTTAGHCYDEYDRMCYNDGGGPAMQYLCNDVAQDQRLDCNKDDYYTTASPTGYLATHWNTADSWFLVRGDAPDTTLPSVSISSPTAGSHLRGSVLITPNHNDNVGIIKADFLIDGVVVLTDTYTPYRYTWSTNTASNGSHTIGVRVYDPDGNSATVTINVVTDNSTPGTISGLTTTAVTASRVDLAWNAATDSIGVDSYDVLRDNVQIGNTASTNYSDTTVSWTSGHTYSVRARDRAGNVGSSISIFVAQPSNLVPVPVYRFWSDRNRTHFYTISDTEKNYVQVTYASTYRYEGPVFQAWTTSNCSGRSSVHRFYSDRRGVHFYTISETEKNYVQANLGSVYRYEGVAYCAYPAASTSKPLYRFWSDVYQTHFYTASEAEKQYVIDAYDDRIWKYERVAYWVD